MSPFFSLSSHLKECPEWKEHIENTKMGTFEAPDIQEQVYMTI